jgi:hypothetical protein
MGFNAMAPCENKATTHIWAVSKSGLVPVRKFVVLKEGAKNFVLEDGTMVSKSTMQNQHQLFFTSEYAADVVYRHLSSVFDPVARNVESNFDAIKNASVSEASGILFAMIQELCEDGMPTHEEIENWLSAVVTKNE